MIQFYFLSIVLNLFSGYALVLDPDSPSEGWRCGLKSIFGDRSFRLVVGVLSIAVGLFKLISVVRSDVQIVGDLFPSAAGILSGIALVSDFRRTGSAESAQIGARADLIFAKNRKWIGSGAIIAAIAHFLFPSVLFL